MWNEASVLRKAYEWGVIPIAAAVRLGFPNLMALQKPPPGASSWSRYRASSTWLRAKQAARIVKRRPVAGPRYVLGISAYYHDSAATLLRDGEIVAGAQEERFTRRKHDPSFPSQAVKFCLGRAGVSVRDLSLVVFYEDPILKFLRLLSTFVAFAPDGEELFSAAVPVWMGGKLQQRSMLKYELAKAVGASLDDDRLAFSEHHLSHAASAFFPSPFEDAAVLTLDGVGEFATTTFGVGDRSGLRILKQMTFPHSLGLLYSAFTVYTGFRVNTGEYKVMGLAPYGRPLYANTILDNLIDLRPDGSFWLNMEYFDYGRGLRMINHRFEELFGGPARAPEGPLTQRDMDLAASIQVVIEDAVLRIARHVRKETGRKRLCLAGGVSLNCVANGKLLRAGVFDDLWIQPAAGDAGGALGAAYVGEVLYLEKSRREPKNRDAMKGAYLGPVYTAAEIRETLKQCGAQFEEVEGDLFFERVAQALVDGLAIGWFSGPMEFGPRALGGRSIIADARSEAMQKVLNLKIKFRESFRPFAPAVLAEDCKHWFELDRDSPYMLLVAQIEAAHRRAVTDEEQARFGIEKLNVVRSSVPAITHVDHSARVQTVHRETNPRFHRLLSTFKAMTGAGLVVNTSFNIRGEPIVCSPEDAFRCFMGTELDMLVVENFVLLKKEQNPSLFEDYRRQFAPD